MGEGVTIRATLTSFREVRGGRGIAMGQEVGGTPGDMVVAAGQGVGEGGEAGGGRARRRGRKHAMQEGTTWSQVSGRCLTRSNHIRLNSCSFCCFLVVLKGMASCPMRVGQYVSSLAQRRLSMAIYMALFSFKKF